MKKAVIEVQFNWIFVLIVGALILAFFLGIVLKQKELSQGKLGVRLAADLETITTGAEVSKGTAQPIRVPGLGIHFDSEGCLRRYTIGGGTKQYKEKIIFAPSRIEGTEVLAWTLDWNLPYRITNFLYLTSPFMRYILVAAAFDDFAANINNTLPDRVYKEVISDPTAVQDQNNYKVRLIFFPTYTGQIIVPNSLEYMKNEDVTALSITASDPQHTTVEFYEKSGTNFQHVGTVDTAQLESLYGAIFTDDYEMYYCNLREAFRKMYLVTTVIHNRTNMLYNEVSLSSGCIDEYAFALTSLDTLYAESQGLYSEFPGGLSGTRIDTVLDEAFVNLEQYNKNLQLQSCPEMY